MKRTLTALGILTAVATPAIAAGATETETIGWITILLIGVGGLVVVSQLIPAIVLLRGIVQGLFGRGAARGAAKTEPVTELK